MAFYIEDTLVRSCASCESQHYQELVIATRVMGDIYKMAYQALETFTQWKKCEKNQQLEKESIKWPIFELRKWGWQWKQRLWLRDGNIERET